MYAIRNNEGAYWHGQLGDQLDWGSIEKAKRYLTRDEAQKAADALMPTYPGEWTVCTV